MRLCGRINLSEEMHRRGINVRCCGRLYKHSRSALVRRFLMSEVRRGSWSVEREEEWNGGGRGRKRKQERNMEVREKRKRGKGGEKDREDLREKHKIHISFTSFVQCVCFIITHLFILFLILPPPLSFYSRLLPSRPPLGLYRWSHAYSVAHSTAHCASACQAWQWRAILLLLGKWLGRAYGCLASTITTTATTTTASPASATAAARGAVGTSDCGVVLEEVRRRGEGRDRVRAARSVKRISYQVLN